MYPDEYVIPRKKDLTDFGFEGVTSEQEVESAIKADGTTFVVLNSICGCAAANARPAAKMATSGENKPDRLITAFAGVDKEAINKIREFMLPYPPSSPSMALFKDGKLVSVIERHQIEGRPAELIAENLNLAFKEYC